MPRTHLRHFLLHSILLHIFLGVVITLALIYLFDKETGSGEGQAGGRLEPIIVSVIDESDISQQSSENSNETPQTEQEKEDSSQESIVLEETPKITKEETIKNKPEVKPVPAAKELKNSEKREKESVADKSAVTKSDSTALAESAVGEKSTGTEGAESEKETENTSPGELTYNVSEGARPNYGMNPNPPYPKSARRRGQEGTVLLRVLVLEDGKVGEIEIVNPSGYTVLDESALKAVKDWVFIPGKKAGKQISSWVEVPIKFQLDSG